MAEKTAPKLKNSIYGTLKDRLNKEIGVKNKDEKIAELLKAFLKNKLIEIGTEISVTDLSKNLNISRNTAESVYPSASKRGNNLSISEFSKEKNVLLKTSIVSCEMVSKKDLETQSKDSRDQKFINKIWPALDLDSETTKLLEIRRIREFKGKDDKDFRKGISEVSYINPEICPDMLADYQNPEFENIGFHEYYSQKNLVLVRSEFTVKARNLSSFHIAPWLIGKKITKKKEIETLIENNSKLTKKAFLRINCVSFCQFGPVEVSLSYFDTDVISLESTHLQPLFIP